MDIALCHIPCSVNTLFAFTRGARAT